MSVHVGSAALAEIAVRGSRPPAHVVSCSQCSAELASFGELVSGLRLLPQPPPPLRAGAGAYFARRRAIDGLIASMASEPLLRARAAADPEGVLRDAGLDPDPDLVAALRDVERDSTEAGQRLAARLWF